MSAEFDPDAILNHGITEAEYEGKRAMTPEGAYPDSTVTEVRAFEPHEKSKEKGVEARLLVSFECPNYDGDLSTFINFKKNPNPRATYMKLLKAVWPDKAVAVNKTPSDLVGQTININVFHEDGDFGAWADFRFTPAI